MKTIDESALLGYCYHPLHERGIYLESVATEEHLGSVQALLVGLLSEEAQGGQRVERREREVSASEVTSLKLVVGKTAEDGQTVRLYTFGLKDSAIETALPLLGMALTVFTGIPNWGLVPQLGGVLKTLWSKIIVLERPEDGDAIDAIETIIALRADNYWNKDPTMPRSADIMAALGWPEDRFKAVLSKLKTSKIIEAAAWGGQRDDLGHPDTRWRVKL